MFRSFNTGKRLRLAFDPKSSNLKAAKMTRIVIDKGKTKRAVDPKTVVEALGAEDAGLKIDVKEGPISALALRQFLAARLKSTGGRPRLAGTTKIRRKISFFEEDWDEIVRLSRHCREKEGLKVTSSQVAAALIHAGILGIETKKIKT